MKKLMLFICVLAAAATVWALPGDALWSRTYGGAGSENLMDVQRTSDGNYIMCGQNAGYGAAQSDGWVVKITPQGDTLWTRLFDAGQGDDFYKVRELRDGSLILGGITDAHPYAYWSHAWLLKLTANGDILWSRFYTHGSNAHNYLLDLEPLPSGGFVFCGISGASTWYSCDAWVVLTDAGGSVVQNRTFNRQDADGASCIRLLPDGFIMCGNTRPSLHHDQGWLFKLNSAADTVWTRTYGGPAGDLFISLAVTADGYVMAGACDETADYVEHSWLMKVNLNGDSLWSRSSTGSVWATPYHIMQVWDGGFAIAGTTAPFYSTAADMYLQRTDANGNPLWSHTYGGTDNDGCNGLIISNDGSYLLAGYTWTFGIGQDGWLVKTEPEQRCVGYTTLEIPGPMDWDYRLHWVSGALSRLVFRNVCPGTHGVCGDGATTAGWHSTDYGDSVVFSTPNPLFAGSLENFILYHPTCIGQIVWQAGDSSGNVDGPLPVELLNFSAQAGDGSATLRWSTASETNASHFDISRDGERVAQVPCRGSISSGAEYAWSDEQLENGRTYDYTLVSEDFGGRRDQLGVRSVTPVRGAETIRDYALFQNYPNPFNAITEIRYAIPEAAHVILKLYDVMGREVATLVDAHQTASSYRVSLNASALATGIYLYRMEAGSFSDVKKLVVMR